MSDFNDPEVQWEDLGLIYAKYDTLLTSHKELYSALDALTQACLDQEILLGSLIGDAQGALFIARAIEKG